MRHDDVKKILLEDPATLLEYEKLRPRYEAIALLLKARKEQNITQEELAQRIGTQKSNISRFENGSCNPSLDFLAKVAHGLGKELHIELRPSIPNAKTVAAMKEADLITNDPSAKRYADFHEILTKVKEEI